MRPDWAILKVFRNKFPYKRSQIICRKLGLFGKTPLFKENLPSQLFATFGQNWATCYSNIWSHWTGREPRICFSGESCDHCTHRCPLCRPNWMKVFAKVVLCHNLLETHFCCCSSDKSYHIFYREKNYYRPPSLKMKTKTGVPKRRDSRCRMFVTTYASLSGVYYEVADIDVFNLSLIRLACLPERALTLSLSLTNWPEVSSTCCPIVYTQEYDKRLKLKH